MGKKRIVKPEGESTSTADSATVEVEKKKESKSSRRRIDSGVLYVESSYNNTKLTLTDEKNNTLAWSSSGSLGFKGAKKGTPFAAAKVGETLALKAQTMGIKEVKVVVKGVGSGRESAIRGFISKGTNLTTIQDKTAVPHNGPKPPKPRRT
ncbi:MAG: 30S ribosomal protein S11 [Candidatus Zambryskibacteria bacterium CG_4_9_14_3_um_filter_42_9]|uniref:Small ribosomal subunit protein uS11 n=1 Tax=Candidatus Zambryskibacteria bacterium CG22_combo_CG10-13_8_21_14_all_42_17 TaxID=1975118 RepID=A0A2H0BED6_9BACT|nr:MAG: 30S ribosomal protein S11 [Candidatus Zambryskibacteria bacterium CG22_combo_CG10-13_8_21_14_all_42_17]PJA36636.1 MAG: 30S ribosomal protein S11 [Candidatus Zambryskibacteria bacterium CG_4_9_14_3_um_filter_42_9]